MNVVHLLRGSLLLAIASSCASETETAGPYPNNKGGSGGGDASSQETSAGKGGTAGKPLCTPKTCTQLGASCGEVPDGCGSKLSCGTCTAPQKCGGGGKNVCGSNTCFAKTCQQLGASCGLASDQCAVVIECGSCATGECSASNQCVGGGGAGGTTIEAGTGGAGGNACLSLCNNVECGDYQGCACGDCTGVNTCVNNHCVPGGTGGASGASGASGGGGTSGAGGSTPCSTTCQGHCGTYQGCPCGDTCTAPQTCQNNLCKDSCSSVCSGHCGQYQSCDCGNCSGGWVCLGDSCVECVAGQVDTDSCSMTYAVCNPGERSRSCSGNHWGAYDQCAAASGTIYRGDGQEHCGSGTGTALLCLEIPTAGGDTTVEVKVSKFDDGYFYSSHDMTITQPSTGKTQYFGCQPADYDWYVLHIDPGMFELGLDGKAELRVETTVCGNPATVYTSTLATLYQCRP